MSQENYPKSKGRGARWNSKQTATHRSKTKQNRRHTTMIVFNLRNLKQNNRLVTQ